MESVVTPKLIHIIFCESQYVCHTCRTSSLYRRKKLAEQEKLKQRCEESGETVIDDSQVVENIAHCEENKVSHDIMLEEEFIKMGLLQENISPNNVSNNGSNNATSMSTLTTDELCAILTESSEGEGEESFPYNVDSNINAFRIETAHIKGNCIINFGYVFQQLHSLFDNHSPLNCNFRDLVLIGTYKNGLRSKFIFQCHECHYSADIWSEPAKQATLNVDEGAMAGTILAGIGYSQLEELLESLNIKNMSYNKYSNLHNTVANAIERAAKECMKKAAEEERNMAIERQEIVHGIPHITVVADGSWMKRSYRTGKYDSWSGVGVICGAQTKKVLHIGVRNKYCASCHRAEKVQERPSEHKCYKNWSSNRSSTSMEADAIVEGFKSSLSHGLIYSKLIADGDSSVYKKIREANPYRSIFVEKIECRNHLLRNLMWKIKQICMSKGRFGKLRKVIGSRSLRIRSAVTKAVEYRISENTSMKEKMIQLRRDIMNIVSHVFDEHKECAEIGYFCDGISKENVTNYVPDLKASHLYDMLQHAMKQLSWNAKSLLHDKDSNRAESVNALIAKCIGGKRINFGLRGSYEARCYAAVLACNTISPITHLAIALDRQPGIFAIEVQNKRKRKREMASAREKEKTYVKRAKPATTDEDYVPHANRPDADTEEMEVRIKEHMDMLYEWQRKRVEIEEESRDQDASGSWQQYRSKLLTASHFGNICKMRPSTSCASKVKAILYPKDIRVEAVQYGKECEEIARNTIAKELNKCIERCGLFIDEEIAFIAASPDGLIDDDGILEIKCPFAARSMTPEDAISKNVSNLRSLYRNKEDTKMNVKHHFYYQVQGQLHITKRTYCIFAIWTSLGIKLEKIMRDDTFWRENMVQRLKQFYKHCILPEIVDPRLERNMPIRDPEYIVEAKRIKEKEKIQKSSKKSKTNITWNTISKETSISENMISQET